MVKADDVHRLLAGISAGFSHSSLTKLTLGNLCESEELAGSDPATYIIQSRSMRSLLCFHDLTRLSITSFIGFDLDDSALAELARAWPQIITLCLSSIHHTYTPHATAACLQSFAQHCPRLSQLTLAFDGAAIPGAENTARPRSVQHSLTMLNVQQSSLTTPISVARFISGLFPTLSKIETYREDLYNEEVEADDEEYDVIRIHHRWKEVQTFLPVLSAVREEGRAWALGL
ncbi:hypothetical protein DFH06DRAFT_1347413 [Mycena polygramma]|nr:hypothetical protein DFH06DRAFT_1347413 [Mycena polygramma]